MKAIILAFALAGATAQVVWAEDYSAETARDRQVIKQERAARVAALKAHDAAAAAKAAAALHIAYEKSWDDQAAAKASATPLAPGETRAVQLALIQAKDNYEDAVASGDRAAIAKAKREVSVAYHNDWVARHAKHAPK